MRRGWTRTRERPRRRKLEGWGRIFFINQSSDQRRHARNARARTAALIGTTAGRQVRHVGTTTWGHYALGQPRTTGIRRCRFRASVADAGSPSWRDAEFPSKWRKRFSRFAWRILRISAAATSGSAGAGGQRWRRARREHPPRPTFETRGPEETSGPVRPWPQIWSLSRPMFLVGDRDAGRLGHVFGHIARMSSSCLAAVAIARAIVRHEVLLDSSLPAGGALARHQLVQAASSSGPPVERGVGVPSSRSLSRQLVKRIQCTGTEHQSLREPAVGMW